MAGSDCTDGSVKRPRSLQWRLALLLALTALAALAVHAGLTRGPLQGALDALAGSGDRLTAPSPDGVAGVALTMLLLLPAMRVAASLLLRPLTRLLRALESVVLSYRDGDINRSIAPHGDGELGDLVALHNALGLALREQRQHLMEREALLDTLVQNTPVAMLLIDEAGRIAYANIAARQLVGAGRSLEGARFADLLGNVPVSLRSAVEGGVDSMFAVPGESGDEVFHFSRRAFRLKGRPHELHLLRRMTREMSRQEVATWKRVIRVMSHELNNSLAPISSLAHSGAELARRGDGERLPAVFATIGERALHLHQFLAGYARVAKLPAPRAADVDWPSFVDALAAQHRFRLEGPLPSRPGFFDVVQVEQALINLLRNAHEAGGRADEVVISIRTQPAEQCIAVRDRGPGMEEAVLTQALLPFYSTKREGSGLGLALCREIAEAHGGRLSLANRQGGGVCVCLFLPDAAEPSAALPAG